MPVSHAQEAASHASSASSCGEASPCVSAAAWSVPEAAPAAAALVLSTGALPAAGYRVGAAIASAARTPHRPLAQKSRCVAGAATAKLPAAAAQACRLAEAPASEFANGSQGSLALNAACAPENACLAG